MNLMGAVVAHPPFPASPPPPPPCLSLVCQVWVRGFLQANTSQGGGVFMVLREALYSIQGVMFKGGDIPNAMVKWAGHISKVGPGGLCLLL